MPQNRYRWLPRGDKFKVRPILCSELILSLRMMCLNGLFNDRKRNGLFKFRHGFDLKEANYSSSATRICTYWCLSSAESVVKGSTKQNGSAEGCSNLKRSVDMTSSGMNCPNIRTNASPKCDRTRCPEE